MKDRRSAASINRVDEEPVQQLATLWNVPLVNTAFIAAYLLKSLSLWNFSSEAITNSKQPILVRNVIGAHDNTEQAIIAPSLHSSIHFV
ncbi:hypothetical protein BH11BAC5_BH11BAC5_23490 [soil metagenome]